MVSALQLVNREQKTENGDGVRAPQRPASGAATPSWRAGQASAMKATSSGRNPTAIKTGANLPKGVWMWQSGVPYSSTVVLVLFSYVQGRKASTTSGKVNNQVV